MHDGVGQPCIEGSNAGWISFGRSAPPLYIARLFEVRALTGAAMTTSENRLNPAHSSVVAGTWRTPALVIGMGCLITLIAFGPRSTLGFFLTPLSSANHWGRDVFAFALAL